MGTQLKLRNVKLRNVQVGPRPMLFCTILGSIQYMNAYISSHLYLVHCEWSSWEVGVCSKSCGGGVRTKSRRTDDNHHEDEPEHCPGMVNLEESCNPEECPGNILAY